MSAITQHNTIFLNNQWYPVVPESYAVQDVTAFPPIVREGHPTYEQLQGDNVVGWDNWAGGFAEVQYTDPDRYYFSNGCDASTPFQVILGPRRNFTSGISDPPLKIRQLLPGELPVGITATAVFQKDSGADTWSSKLSSVTPTDIIAWGDGTNTLYLVAMGNANAYQYTTSLSGTPSWTTSNLTANSDDDKADFWAVGPGGTGINGGTLWKAVKPNKVFATDDPKNTSGHWTSPYYIGSSATDITAFGVFDNRLLVGKPEGLFWVQPDGTVELLIDMSGAVSANNCEGMVSWRGYLFVPWQQGLYQFSGGNLLNLGEITTSFRNVGPNVNAANASAIRGRITAMAPSSDALWAAVESNAGNSYIMKYNGDPVPGRGWHPISLAEESTSIEAMGVEIPSSGNPRLYFGISGLFDGVRYYILSADGDNPLLDSNYRYQLQGTLELAEYASPIKGMTKLFAQLRIEVENVDGASKYVDISISTNSTEVGDIGDLSYTQDDAGNFTALQRVDQEGISTITFSTTTTGRRIILRATLNTDDDTVTPRMRLVELSYQLRPVYRRRWQFDVAAAEFQRTHPTRRPQHMITNLEAARDSGEAVNFQDEYGDTWDVVVETVTRVSTEWPPGKPPNAIMRVSLLEYQNAAGAWYADAEDAIVEEIFAA